MLTCFEFLSANVRVKSGAYFDGVWLMLKIITYGILCFSTFYTISWWKSSSVSFRTPSGISGLEVVATLFTKPIQGKILFAQKHLSTLINFRCSLLLFSIRTLIVAIATIVLTTPPFLHKANKNVSICSSICPNMSGLPRFSADIFSNFYVIYHEKFSRYFHLNVNVSSWIFLQ